MSGKTKIRHISVARAQAAYTRGYDEGAYWRNASNPYTDPMTRFFWSSGKLDRRSTNATPRTIDQAEVDRFYAISIEVEHKQGVEVDA
ncbi:MAG: hypothetical protein ACXWPI_15240 [Ktedonobacterales bacterium]